MHKLKKHKMKKTIMASLFALVTIVLFSCTQTKEIRIKNSQSRKLQKQFNIPKDVRIRNPYSVK